MSAGTTFTSDFVRFFPLLLGSYDVAGLSLLSDFLADELKRLLSKYPPLFRLCSGLAVFTVDGARLGADIWWPYVAAEFDEKIGIFIVE